MYGGDILWSAPRCRDIGRVHLGKKGFGYKDVVVASSKLRFREGKPQ